MMHSEVWTVEGGTVDVTVLPMGMGRARVTLTTGSLLGHVWPVGRATRVFNRETRAPWIERARAWADRVQRHALVMAETDALVKKAMRDPLFVERMVAKSERIGSMSYDRMSPSLARQWRKWVRADIQAQARRNR